MDADLYLVKFFKPYGIEYPDFVVGKELIIIWYATWLSSRNALRIPIIYTGMNPQEDWEPWPPTVSPSSTSLGKTAM